jgi:peptidoglycan/LPS O-acetylase OafA/YrhL
LARGRGNAFDLVRLLLAGLVVFEHSFFLVDHSVARDPLNQLSGGQLNCGQLAVEMFFAVSGFLVTYSVMRSATIADYLARRVGRIFPGFLVACAVGVLLIGPLSSGNLSGYLHAQNWPSLLLGTVFLKQPALHGVFPHNPVAMVHGTLWTIQYEFDCYLILAALAVAGLLRRQWAPFTYAGIALAFVAAWPFAARIPTIDHGVLALLVSSPDRWLDLFPFFFAGSACYLFRSRIPKHRLLCLGAAALWIISLFLGGAWWATLVCGTYVVLFTALSFRCEPRTRSGRVDLSYGIYLYGWPVQQLLLWLSGQALSPLLLFAAAAPLSAVAAFASWQWVEEPCLRVVHRTKTSERLLAIWCRHSTPRAGRTNRSQL